MSGQPQHSLIHHSRPDETPYPREECPIYAALKDGEVHNILDETFWKKDGSRFPVEYVSAPVYEDNVIVGAVVTFKDITERKKVAEELHRHKDHLEELVEERTLELKKSQKQLIHSEKLASLGKLTGSISHEFNNPLQGLRNIIDILSDSAPSDREVRLGDLGKKECDRMAKMIASLRDFYQPSLGKVSKIGINNCIEEAIILNSKALEQKGIQVKKNFSEKLPLIEVVEDQLKQVILNLIQNAADSISGEGQITCATETQESHITIKIQDTGSGFSEDDQEKLFEPFYTTKGIKGTGLGLSVSYGIVKDHGGSIEVESILGKGSTFTVSLPIKTE
ncbi:MAG: PAS domain S-box protein [Nitrospina sp.]|nr:PAS domain S-box protein [Nitrospina sp.]